jgi:putative hydrolase of the HAD superfamily
VQRAIIFDGDDTLWQTEWLYDEARQRARDIVETSRLDGEKWEMLQRQIDVSNVERLGHTVERFPTSCIEAYELLCQLVGRRADTAVLEQIGAAARSAFTGKPPLVPHAREVLTELRNRGYRLVLLTKGDAKLQQKRVEQSGLAQLFDLVMIVEKKTPEVIVSLLEQLGVETDAALSVGNSVRSDIVPSLAAGVQPIWVDAHVWEYEREHAELPDGAVLEVEDLTRVLDVIES